MEAGVTILNQIIMMYFLMILGFFIYRKHWINEQGSQQISNVLLKLCSPCIMIVSFQRTFSWNDLSVLGLTFLLSLAAIVLAIIIAKLTLKSSQRIERFAVSFSNSGFIGIPLVQSLLGVEYIFYLSAFLVAFNLISWSYGVYLISGRKDLITARTLLINPATISLVIGMLLFISPIKLPGVIYQGVYAVGNMNTPLAMIILGSYIARNDLLSIFKNRMGYFVSALRLLLVPFFTLLLLKLLPASLYEIKMIILICNAAPVGVTVAMFAQQYEGDFAYGAQIVSLSTILSFVTIPVFIIIAGMLW